MLEPTLANLLHALALAAYAFGTAVALIDLPRQGAWSRSGVPVLAAIGLVASLANIWWRTREFGRCPVYHADGALLALACCVAFTYLCIEFGRRLRASQAAFLPALLLLTVSAAVLQSADVGRDQVGRGALMAVHLIAVIAAGTASTAALAGGTMYLVHSAMLHRKRLSLLGRLPSLETLENFNYVAAALGFPLLTIAVATGFLVFGGNEAITTGAAGVVKIGLAVGAWFVFGAVMLFVPRFRASLVAKFNIVGFAAFWVVLLTARFAFN
jgi:ABC-type uncharacterized transport system permease subunit